MGWKVRREERDGSWVSVVGVTTTVVNAEKGQEGVNSGDRSRKNESQRNGSRGSEVLWERSEADRSRRGVTGGTGLGKMS